MEGDTVVCLTVAKMTLDEAPAAVAFQERELVRLSMAVGKAAAAEELSARR